MKNASLIFNVVLTIAVAILYFLYWKDHRPEPTVAVVTKAEAPKKPIAYVNVDSLLTKYEFFKDTQKVLESKQFQLQNDLESKGRNLQNKATYFQQRAQTMTQEQGRAAEASLQQEQQSLVQYRDQSTQRLAGEQQKAMGDLYDRIGDYIKKYNKQNKYEFVLGYTKGGGILFADQSNDATRQILDGLNKEYKEKQAVPAKK